MSPNETDDEEDNPGTINVPLPPPLMDVPEKHFNKITTNNSECLSKYEKWELCILSVGIVVAIAAIIVTYIGIDKQIESANDQLKVMQGQLKEMIQDGKNAVALLEQNERQIRTLQDTTEATRASVNMMEQVDRPWIGFIPSPIIDYIEDKKKIRITLTVKNAGNRPAKILEIRSGAIIEKAFKPFYEDTSIVRETGKVIVIPELTSNTIILKSWLKEDIDKKTQNGVFKFYIFGTVTYEDVRTKKVYETNICLHRSIIEPEKYVHCPEYNSAT